MNLTRLLKHTHLGMTLFWGVMVPVSIYTGIWKRVEYVTFLSIWALVITHWGAWQASRAEARVAETESVEVGRAEHVEVGRSKGVGRSSGGV